MQLDIEAVDIPLPMQCLVSIDVGVVVAEEVYLQNAVRRRSISEIRIYLGMRYPCLLRDDHIFVLEHQYTITCQEGYCE